MSDEMNHTLQARLIVQRNDVDGRVACSFLTDPEYPIERCLIPGGSWADSTWSSSPIVVTGEFDDLRELLPRVFVSEDTEATGECIEFGAEQWEELRHYASIWAALENDHFSSIERELLEIEMEQFRPHVSWDELLGGGN